MDHLCEQCGATVEDGRPFCPHCRAPQVRVLVEASPDPAGIATPPSQTPAYPLDHVTFPRSAGSGLLRVALQAGLLGVIANIIPYGLGMVLTGILAPLLHHRAGGARLSAGTAARLGAMAGAVAFALTLVLKVVVFREQQQFRDLMMQALERNAGNPDPAVQAALQWMHTPQGFAVALAAGLIGWLIASMLLSALGGVIGTLLFRDRKRSPF